ncbi:STE24 endopeptidase [Plasticicumulans lactativorans]|uniref:STE24 endopeptidase n=1 Tax=Plasticicumulans lactativorans TaxID=1133106 RepID=A0A4R2LA78_9GAMM|nr:M48 family metallopeptidase [Plasticicumulans lactativorans]TCO82317.1 STE24 endopeptidase [Plasticicumulans lactativorans]
MQAHDFTLIFLTLLVLGTALQLWLAWRHNHHVARHRDRVPGAFAASVSLAEHQRAADYTRARTRLGAVELLLGALVLLGWTLGGGLDALDRLWRGFGLGSIATGVGVIVSALLLGGLLELPLRIYRQFVLEARFGFNRSPAGLFVADLAKGMLVSLAFGVPLTALVLWLMEAGGARWWLWVWGVWAGFNLLMLWAYPTLIAPLFNAFTPLADTALRARIEALLARCGFKASGVFVMDGSRRSGHGNAYFTGIGKAKRIVFYDTLLDRLATDEVEAVLAHELGHFHHRHVLARVVVLFATSLAALVLLDWLLVQPWFFAGLGVTHPSPYLGLLLFLLAAGSFFIFLQPLGAWVSRRHEFEADAYAAAQSDGAALVHALVRLYRDNATTLTPDPLHSAFYDSHPPAPIRIAHLEALLQRPRASA